MISDDFYYAINHNGWNFNDIGENLRYTDLPSEGRFFEKEDFCRYVVIDDSEYWADRIREDYKSKFDDLDEFLENDDEPENNQYCEQDCEYDESKPERFTEIMESRKSNSDDISNLNKLFGGIRDDSM